MLNDNRGNLSLPPVQDDAVSTGNPASRILVILMEITKVSIQLGVQRPDEISPYYARRTVCIVHKIEEKGVLFHPYNVAGGEAVRPQKHRVAFLAVLPFAGCPLIHPLAAFSHVFHKKLLGFLKVMDEIGKPVFEAILKFIFIFHIRIDYIVIGFSHFCLRALKSHEPMSLGLAAGNIINPIEAIVKKFICASYFIVCV
ncbi:MAG: hypothetical protein HFG09_06010 [Oscillibacter sp.]|nr:hypothetical protein [Oscillibacter sp.]